MSPRRRPRFWPTARPDGGPPRADSPGWTVRVVPNKFPALGIEGNLDRQGEGMFDKMNGIGAHEVIIETPEHNASLATLPEKRIEDVLWAFRDRILDLQEGQPLQVHPDLQEPRRGGRRHARAPPLAADRAAHRAQAVLEELEGAKQYFIYKERCVFCDIIRQELESGVRVVCENDDFVTLAPYAPRFPFETWIMPKRHESAFENSSVADVRPPWRSALKDCWRRRPNACSTIPAYNLIMPQLAAAGRAQRPLPLAHRVHAEADQDRRLRVGHRLLHQSHAAGGSGPLPARGVRPRRQAGRRLSGRTAKT